MSYPGRYREVRPERALPKDPAPLKVKEVLLNGKRYIVCINPKQDLKALQEVKIEDNGKSLALRTECLGTCGKVFKAVGVAIPPTIREL